MLNGMYLDPVIQHFLMTYSKHVDCLGALSLLDDLPT